MAELISLERTGRWSLKLIDQVEVGSVYAVLVGSNVTESFFWGLLSLILSKTQQLHCVQRILPF